MTERGPKALGTYQKRRLDQIAEAEPIYNPTAASQNQTFSRPDGATDASGGQRQI